jgi:hypothetical protein
VLATCSPERGLPSGRSCQVLGRRGRLRICGTAIRNRRAVVEFLNWPPLVAPRHWRPDPGASGNPSPRRHFLYPARGQPLARALQRVSLWYACSSSWSCAKVGEMLTTLRYSWIFALGPGLGMARSWCGDATCLPRNVIGSRLARLPS